MSFSSFDEVSTTTGIILSSPSDLICFNTSNPSTFGSFRSRSITAGLSPERILYSPRQGVGKAGENNGEYCCPDPCIPDGYGNGKQEQRICHVVEVEALQEKRPPERHGDGKRRHAIAKHGRAGDLQFEVRSGHGSPRVDCFRAGFRTRLSEEKDHTAEASARRWPWCT